LKEDQRDIIEIRHYKLQTRLEKEKKDLEKQKEKKVYLDMSQNHLDVKFLNANHKIMMEVLSLGDIRELNLNSNDLTDQAIPLLVNLPSVSRLKLRNNLFTPNSFKLVLPLLTSLRHLDLSNNSLTDAFFRNLSLLIIDNHH
jgi:hypothetical protein